MKRPIRCAIQLTALCSTLLLLLGRLRQSPELSPTIYGSEFCPCPRSVAVESHDRQGVDWCSRRSTWRGFHQQTVAISLFGDPLSPLLKSTYGNLCNLSVHPDVFSRYFTNLPTIADQVAASYPGWIVRIYHNFNQSHTEVRQILCQVYCTNDHVDLCDVNEVAAALEQVKATARRTPIPTHLARVNRMIWRYLPLMDPHVDRYMSRDSDSDITQREVAAVNQWLRSDFTFHVMRDHQYHKEAILGGLFGIKVHQRRDLVQGLMRILATLATRDDYGEDQKLLADVFWPVVKDDAVIHDSFWCRSDWNSVPVSPFPTRRVNLTFVADRSDFQFPRPRSCPAACRPADHQDWEYC